MKLSLKALALTGGIMWAGLLFLTGVANLVWAGYGTAFLQVWASVYPGYDAARFISDVIVGTLYAFVDGAAVALIFGWLYNLLVGKSTNA